MQIFLIFAFAVAAAQTTYSVIDLTTATRNKRVVIINNNDGGLIFDYEMTYNYYKRAAIAPHFSGSCASACTIFLSLPNACTWPSARFVFHEAIDQFNNYEPLNSRVLYDHYPILIQRIIGWPLPKRGREIVVTGEQLIQLGYTQCMVR